MMKDYGRRVQLADSGEPRNPIPSTLPILEDIAKGHITEGHVLEMEYNQHNEWLYLGRDNRGIKVFPVPPVSNPHDAVTTIIKSDDLKGLDYKVTGQFTNSEWIKHMENSGYTNSSN